MSEKPTLADVESGRITFGVRGTRSRDRRHQGTRDKTMMKAGRQVEVRLTARSVRLCSAFFVPRPRRLQKGRRARRAMRGMFLKHIVPSIAQALGLMLVIMSFVSPVPFHDSDISLVYIGPNVLDYPAAPNASAVPPKTVVAAELSKASETNVRYRMGLLGSCFTNAQRDMFCTPSSMHPRHNTTWLATEPGVHWRTSSLPTSWTTYPSLVLFSWFLVLATTPIVFRRLYLWMRPQTPKLRLATLRLLWWALYVQDVGAWLLLACMISLRVRIARVVDTFNTDNDGRVLEGPAISMLMDGAPPLGLRADPGTGFSCMTVAAILFLGMTWLERFRLYREEAAPDAQGDDPEAAVTTSAWRRLWRTPVSEPPKPMDISAPLPARSDASDDTWSVDKAAAPGQGSSVDA